jgi:hypothetical protein
MPFTADTLSVEFLYGMFPSVSFTTYTIDTGAKEMSWNYRVVYDPIVSALDDIGEYAIREVFYNDDGEIAFWSGEAAVPNADSYEELQAELVLFQAAFELPCLMSVIDEDTHEEALVEWVEDTDEDVDIADNDE